MLLAAFDLNLISVRKIEGGTEWIGGADALGLLVSQGVISRNYDDSQYDGFDS
jgi:hypothetical protein